MYAYPVALHAIYSSPSHNYFTRKKFDIGDAPTLSHTSVDLEPGRGIPGDRFEHARYPLTFFSCEVAEAVAKALHVPFAPELFRRNILLGGINLGELIGERFRIGDILFEGDAHCAPCTWMNAALGKGAYDVMRGRGGLRAHVVEGGTLQLGQQLLACEHALTRDPLEPLKKIPLP